MMVEFKESSMLMFTFHNNYMYWTEIGGEYNGKCFRKHVEEAFK